MSTLQAITRKIWRRHHQKSPHGPYCCMCFEPWPCLRRQTASLADTEQLPSKP